MKKPDLTGKPVNKIFPEAVKEVSKGICPTCSKEISDTEFRDELSIKEYYVSGLCQACQDRTFG